MCISNKLEEMLLWSSVDKHMLIHLRKFQELFSDVGDSKILPVEMDM